jgi:serine protease AprX
MRKTTYEAGTIVRWRTDADPTPRLHASHALDGGSWTFQRHTGQGFLRTLAALLTTLALLAAAATPALAGKGGNGNGGNGGDSGPQSCSSVLGEFDTTSLSEIRQQIGADDALNTYGLSGGGVGVAVIDTGVNQVDGLSQNGKVVDGPDLSFDALDDNLRHRDLHGHGTNMAAIIAAENTASGDGVVPDAEIVNVRVGAGDGTVDVSQVIAAIDWVVANRDLDGVNIRVINLAFDTDATQSYLLDPLSHAVENAWNAGIVVVVAGGNDGRGIHQLGNPAINPHVIAVGALSSPGYKAATRSSTGDGVRNPDLVAPGDSVLSAAVPGSYLADTYPDALCTDNHGDLSLRGSGTSQAAAVVAGAAALLVEQRPELTPDQVKYLLTSTATNIVSTPAQAGHGKIDLAAALAAPTPGVEAVQAHAPSTGLGSLDAARGSFHVGTDGDYLDGEMTAFGGTWTPTVWATASDAGQAWTDQTYTHGDNVWTGGTWMGATWSGATWSGATWSGATWSGATWSGATWSGATWSGATWSGNSWL